jgi:hypothetical protein
MSSADRIYVVLAVFAASSSSGDGAAMVARWMGAGDAVAATVFFAATFLAFCVFVSAVQAYGRHGWRGE